MFIRFMVRSYQKTQWQVLFSLSLPLIAQNQMFLIELNMV